MGFLDFDFEKWIEEAARKLDLHPVMDLPAEYRVLELSESDSYNSGQINELIESGEWAVGGYLENRTNMYLAPQYENRRNIHMGVDIWAPAGEPCYAVTDGKVCYLANNDQDGNYGGTVVIMHKIDDFEIYALYGHLSLRSLELNQPGKKLKPGDIVGWLGDESENGNWPPHLHYQLSVDDPEEADMPGVVAAENLINMRTKHPDPRILLPGLY